MTKVCTFDNPAIMHRECWSDGKLVVSYDFKLLKPFAKIPIPAELFFFGANIGEWNEGQIIGDPDAIGKEFQHLIKGEKNESNQ